MITPKYSICICNYNMNDTLERSISSILNQVDDKIEIIVVDDGSNDNSIETLKKIKNDNLEKNFNFIPLCRDRRRKLGETRNISIKAARGKYVILHIDADDIWEPYIYSFIKVFHELEKRLNRKNFMLSGRQIQMATRNLLIENPYENVYYGEDRLLWSKLTTIGCLISLEHRPFRERIPLVNKRKKLLKAIFSQSSAMTVSFSYSPSIFDTLKGYLRRIFLKSDWGFTSSFLNFSLLIPSLCNGAIINRHKLYNLARWDYRKLTMIDLNKLEYRTKDKYGIFELSPEERKIYFEN